MWHSKLFPAAPSDYPHTLTITCHSLAIIIRSTVSDSTFMPTKRVS